MPPERPWPGHPHGGTFMLQIKNLTITHKKDLRVILKDFQFVLNPGDKAALIGEEGNGKSTLLKWIHDPESIESYAEAEGERILCGERLGYLPQELPEAAREMTVYEFFSAKDEFWELSPKELAKLSGELSLEPDFFYREQKMKTLSGGERVKAQMARILMEQPTMLLLDEPSNDIDIETLEWLERLIRDSARPVLFISHDETLLERTANTIIHLEQLRRKTECACTVAKIPYRQYMEERAARLSNQEQQALNERREEKKRQEKFRRIQQKVEHDLNAVSRQNPHGGYLLKKKMRAVKAMERRYEREAAEMTRRPETEDAIFFKIGEHVRMPSGKMVLELELEQLTVPGDEARGPAGPVPEQTQSRGYWPDTGAAAVSRVLTGNVRLRVRGGEKVCIIGRNGVGKTTLLRQIAKELLSRRDIRACYMPQDYEELLDMSRTPVEYLCPTGEREEISRIRTWLGSLKFTADEMCHPISELSGGQKAKVLLLSMSLSDADVLILDEPTRNFSPLSGPVIRRMLREYRGAIISISHDRKYMEEVATVVYRLTRNGLEPING